MSLKKEFTFDDIVDKKLFNEIFKKKVQSIYRSSWARQGRTLKQVRSSVKVGFIPEFYIVENTGLEFATGMYNDLIDNNGNIVEIKVRSVGVKTTDEAMQNTINEIRSHTRIDYLILVHYVRATQTYTLAEKVKI